MKVLLLASAPDLEGIIKMICKYWYIVPAEIVLQSVNEKKWDIYRRGERLDSFQVVKKGKRIHFEVLC